MSASYSCPGLKLKPHNACCTRSSAATRAHCNRPIRTNIVVAPALRKITEDTIRESFTTPPPRVDLGVVQKSEIVSLGVSRSRTSSVRAHT